MANPVVVQSFAKASLPTPTAGTLVRVTDSVRGLWMATGAQWFGINGEMANVKEFGAKGDGVTDDTAAIQNAYAASTSGIILFPPGTYNFTDLVLDNTGGKTTFWLLGSGKLSTKLNYTGSGIGWTIKNVGRFRITGMELAKSGAQGATGILFTSNAVGSSTGPAWIDDLRISNFSIGAQFGEASGKSASELAFCELELNSNATGLYSPAGAIYVTNINIDRLYCSGVNMQYVADWQSRGGLRICGGSVSGTYTKQFRLNAPYTGGSDPFVIDNLFTEGTLPFIQWGPDSPPASGTGTTGGTLTVRACIGTAGLVTDTTVKLNVPGAFHFDANTFTGLVEAAMKVGTASSWQESSLLLTAHSAGSDPCYKLTSPENLLVEVTNNIRGRTGFILADEKFYVDTTATRQNLEGLGIIAIGTPLTFAGFGVGNPLTNLHKARYFGDLGVENARVTAAGIAGATWKALGELRRCVYAVTIPTSIWTAAALTQDLNIAFALAGTTFRVMGVYSRTTQAYAGLAGTITLRFGKTTGGQEYILDHDVKTATVDKGALDADLGTSINRANAVQGADHVSWTAQTNFIVRLTSGSGNLGTGSATNLTAGSTTIYLITESLP